MQLSEKQNTFSQFFFAFSKSISNFKHLPKKNDPHADVFPDILAPQNMVR